MMTEAAREVHDIPQTFLKFSGCVEEYVRNRDYAEKARMVKTASLG